MMPYSEAASAARDLAGNAAEGYALMDEQMEAE